MTYPSSDFEFHYKEQRTTNDELKVLRRRISTLEQLLEAHSDVHAEIRRRITALESELPPSP